jgi:hypothetical protein
VKASHDRIFVQIPAYRDAELRATLIELYTKAERPDRLRVSVFWQRGPDEGMDAATRNLPHLELIEVSSRRSRGCNWARCQVQKRWRGEPYTLLIDSHHRFVEGWDCLLQGMHQELVKSGVHRPLLTSYMPRYEPLNDPVGRQSTPYRIYPKEYEAGLLIHLTSYPIRNWHDIRSPVPAQFASGHFIFAAGEFNQLVPMDPDLYFTGDEVAISLRAYTHGFDLFHPHLLIGWHCYDRATRIPHWDDHTTWWQRHRISLQRLRKLFSGSLRGQYGVGSQRSIEQFESQLLLPLVEHC